MLEDSDVLKPSRRTRAKSAIDSVLNEIERNISEGVWRPGYRLPTEREFEQRTGLARATVRRGLKQLERQGKIVRQVGRGSFVADTAQTSVASLSASLTKRVLDASPAEIMEVRLMLEPKTAQIAAVRASGAELDRLTECLEGAEKAPDLATFEFWDGTLHQTIIGAARNALLTEIYAAINGIRNQPAWKKLKERTVTRELQGTYHEQHTKLVQALRNRDTEAAHNLMQEHLIAVRTTMLGQ